MITIDELISINTQIHLDGIVPACSETLREVCIHSISQYKEIERLRDTIKEQEQVLCSIGPIKCRNGKTHERFDGCLYCERDDAYEKAAQVCDEQERLQYATGCDECAIQAKRDAYFIRSLKHKEPKIMREEKLDPQQIIHIKDEINNLREELRVANGWLKHYLDVFKEEGIEIHHRITPNTEEPK